MNRTPIDVHQRRGFLRQVVSATAGAPFAPALVGAAAASTWVAHAAEMEAATTSAACAPAAGYLSFSQDEAAFVEAMVNVMCPADEWTPNGVESGLSVYIDRQLAGDFGHGAKRYSRGPWQQGKPQHGYQLPMTPEQHFKAGLAAADAACLASHGKPFDQIGSAEADGFLTDIAAGRVTDPRLPMAAWFNELVYPLFAQACFADPIYGGNRGKAFWKLIGYPGLPATHTVNMIQYRGKPFPGGKDPKSIADFS